MARIAALIAVLASLMPATSAWANTVPTRTAEGLSLTGDGAAQSLEVRSMTFEGGPTPTYTAVVADNNAGGFSPLPSGCTIQNGNELRCEGLPGRLIQADLGGGNDDFRVETDDIARVHVLGGEGVDTLAGGISNDQLDAGNSLPSTTPEVLQGGDGNDHLKGGEGQDIFFGGRGADIFEDDGTQGEDKVSYFGEGRTDGVTVTMDDGGANDGHPSFDGHSFDNNPMLGGDNVGPGIVRVDGSELGDKLSGRSSHADVLAGAGGDDTLDGLAGKDRYFGGPGNDTLNANDGVADDRIDCDSSDTGVEGTADVANVDAADPAPLDCETVNKPGGGGTNPDPKKPAPTPGPTPAPTPAPALPAGELGPSVPCPTKASLFLRPDISLAAVRERRAKLHVDLPVAGWGAILQVVPAAGGGLLGVPTAVVAKEPGTHELVFGGPLATAGPVNLTLSVFATGCQGVVVTDTAELDPTPDGESSGPVGRAAHDYGNAPPIRVDCSKLRDNHEHVHVQAGNYICDFKPEPPPPPKCEESTQLTSFAMLAGACIKKQPDGKWVSEAAVKLNGIVISASKNIVWDPQSLTLGMNGSIKIAVPFTHGGIKSDELVLYEGSGFSWKLSASDIVIADDKVSKKGKIKGFPIEGSAKLKLTAGGGTLDLRFKLPKRFAGIKGLQGGTLLKFGPTGTELTDAVLKVPEAEIAKFKLKEGELRYKRKDGKDVWSGKVTAEIPSPGIGEKPSATLEATFVDGKFSEGGLTVEKINRPFGHPAVFLQKLGGKVSFADEKLDLEGTIGVSAGPKLGFLRLAEAEGTIGYSFGDPGEWRGTLDVGLLGGSKAKGEFKYSTDGRLDIDGQLLFKSLIVSIDGRVKASLVLPNRVTMQGQVTLNVAGFPVPAAQVAADNNAVTICGIYQELQLGLTIRLTDPLKVEPLTGCGLDTFGPVGGGGARAAQAGASTNLPAGLPSAAFAAVGRGGLPNVVLVGPGGRRIVPGAKQPGVVAFANALDGTVYFLVSKPEAGQWSLEVQPGSVPLAETKMAKGVEAPQVRGTVRRDGKARLIEWTAEGPSDQRITFVEEGSGVSREIGTVRGTKGSFRFIPADGEAGTRKVLAQVARDGLPVVGLEIGSFKAGAPPAPGKIPCDKKPTGGFYRPVIITIGGLTPVKDCRAVRLERGDGDKVKVAWEEADNADGYRVAVRTDSGRRSVELTSASKRSVTIDDVDREDGVLVEVAAFNEDRDFGPTARDAIRAANPPKRRRPSTRDANVVGVAEVTAG